MAINQELEKLLNDKSIKFTLILGSGFHRQAQKKNSILSSWSLLLSTLKKEVQLTDQYHLDFEKIIQSEKPVSDDSSKTESDVIKRVQDLIKSQQDRIIDESTNCYPMRVFNPNKVSDVISLNFDEIPELLLGKQKDVKVGKYINESSFKKSSKNAYDFLSTRYKPVIFNDKKIIRFWHPHGVITNNKSIVLGAHRYAKMVSNTIRIRNHHLMEKKANAADNTWYKCLIDNPVIIIGAGMSPSEWDMWYALASRDRTNGISKPIFQMRECECKKDAQHQWFEPLFTGMTFDQQWKKLEELFKTK
jgi:hypothetical protein